MPCRRDHRPIDQLQRLKLPTTHDRTDTIDSERALTTVAQRSRRVHGEAVSVLKGLFRRSDF